MRAALREVPKRRRVFSPANAFRNYVRAEHLVFRASAGIVAQQLAQSDYCTPPNGRKVQHVIRPSLRLEVYSETARSCHLGTRTNRNDDTDTALATELPRLESPRCSGTETVSGESVSQNSYISGNGWPSAKPQSFSCNLSIAYVSISQYSSSWCRIISASSPQISPLAMRANRVIAVSPSLISSPA